MNIKTIIEEKLKEIGADGLCSEGISCGCGIADLFPCSSESGIENCMPAKKSIATYEDSKKHGFIFEEGQVIYKEMKL